MSLDYDNPATPDPYEPSIDMRRRFVPGGTFILDAPDRVPALWGEGDAVLWAQGESLILGGPPGVGKTTVAAQLVRGRIVGGTVLDLSVALTGSRVLYLAMDRPQQIARALRRTLGDLPRDLLDDRLTFWKGPPVTDVARHPETLVGYAELAGADTIVVDSLKDAAIGLIEDEVGAGYNRARQLAIAAGVEVLELHHTVKRGPGGAKPKTLADLYGSAWLTAGAGSVVLFWGEAGDPIVELVHLKSPAAEVGPFRVIHDHAAGTSAVWHAADLLTMAQAKGDAGLTAKDGARALFSTGTPSTAQVEKARRKLDALAAAGKLVPRPGDRGAQRPTMWVVTSIADSFTRPAPREGITPLTRPSRPDGNAQVSSITETFTSITDPHHHVSLPLSREGNVSGCPLHAVPAPDACVTCERLEATA